MIKDSISKIPNGEGYVKVGKEILEYMSTAEKIKTNTTPRK